MSPAAPPPSAPDEHPPASAPAARPRHQPGGEVGRTPVSPGAPDPGAGDGLPLPHEREQQLGDIASEPDPVIEQAARDLAAGQVDTDLRATPGLDAERRAELLRRR
jgi:hypothetical protein